MMDFSISSTPRWPSRLSLEGLCGQINEKRRDLSLLENIPRNHTGYTCVQCIGLDITPFPDNQSISYYGGHDDPETDLTARCLMLMDAILKTVQSKRIDDAAHTLKVFMAPEFFFRGASGCYEAAALERIMSTMRKFTAHPYFSNWLFVHGTAVGSYTVDNQQGKTILNTALVQRGGEETGNQGSWVTYKEHLSPIDFNGYKKTQGSMQAFLGGNDPELFQNISSARPSNFESEQNNGINGGAIIALDNLRIGIEICLDHKHDRLTSICAKPKSTKFDEQGLDIQLLISAGAELPLYGLATKENGVAFSVDAYRGSSVIVNHKLVKTSHKSSINFNRSLNGKDEVKRFMNIKAGAKVSTFPAIDRSINC